MNATNRLTGTRIGHRFGPLILFRRMDFTISGGRSTAVTGANGSGKSTFVRIIAGLLHPSRGEITLTAGGEEIPGESRPLFCGLVAPYLNVYEHFTARENLNFLMRARGLGGGSERVERSLDDVQLLDRADDTVGTFSSGMLQRIRFACALLADPPVLLLDEPTATLDEGGVAMVRSLTQDALDRGKIVIIATNERREAALCEERIHIEDHRPSSAPFEPPS